MSFNNFKTYGDSPQIAFETLCTQLFERYLRRTYGSRLIKFRVINGAGGDGGIEAYGELDNGDLIVVQAKWFRDAIGTSEINQIKKSIETALTLRKNIVEYIVCVPRALGSVKFGRGKKGATKKPITNPEELIIDRFTDVVEAANPMTNITWWLEQDLELQILEDDNEGMHKFWFEKDIISLTHLIQQFGLEKAAWFEKKYTPELHGQGVIQHEIQQLLFSQSYRKELNEKLSAGILSCENSADLISRFKEPLEGGSPLYTELSALLVDINTNLGKISPIGRAIAEGANEFIPITFVKINISDELLEAIEAIKPVNTQLGVQKRLISALGLLRKIDLQDLIAQIADDANQKGRLFLGNSGTGKTHALTNTVDLQLNTELSPALIIRAKGTPCGDWSQILRKALDLEGWNKNEILSALETLALRTDYHEAQKLSAGEEMKSPPTKVVICIDGLEEDTAHWPDWYERMRESVELMKRYPKVRFVFTARTYFFDEAEVPSHAGFKVTTIPMEGDVPVSSVIDQYFSPAHYNITVTPKSLIRGIDSLYALRLFCDLYSGQVLTSESEILTAEQELLKEKIKRIEEDFKKIKDTASTRKPVKETINILSEIFYKKAEIEHDELVTALESGPGKYLGKDDLDKLIDFLANNGFLIKSELPTGKGATAEIKTMYNLTYQSIMELIMSEKFAEGISGGEHVAIPEALLATSDTRHHKDESQVVNERIIQNIVNKVFREQGKLIGDDGFLTKGLEKATIDQLRLKALIQAPAAVAVKLRQNIDDLYFQNHKSRSFVFGNLIYPSAASSANYFGAEYLHELLMKQPSAFERELVWLGWDSHDIHELDKPDSDQFYRYDLRNFIDPYGEGDLHLPEFSLYNEYPLIYGWALSTLDQSLRERLRVALTEWAIAQPMEFLLLLDKLFPCNDPQIQEDLASIMLGVASKLKDKEALLALAEWAMDNIFARPGDYPNIIIRAGFRAIVERALTFGVIIEEEAERTRPRQVKTMPFIPVDKDALEQGGEEIYPVVHDLAWYVIKRAFNDFLDYESVDAGDEPDEPGPAFLMAYLKELGIDRLSAYAWTISAAIAYMKHLGFSRTEENGNGYTDASHGSKSKHFTLEEKYTWLAVHYLQGYLSDYLPLEKNGEFVTDYMAITDVPNPAEFLTTTELFVKVPIEENWVIKELLAPEMQATGTTDEKIKAAVENEPEIDFGKWLQFKEKDFWTEGTEDDWLALFNYTSVHDSQEYINSSIDIRGVIVEKGQVTALLELLRNHPRRTSFVEHIDRMVGSPDTDTYSNPSDIVWMNWIEETEFEETYYMANGDEKSMRYSVTSVTKNTVDGEREIYIPSKLVRTLIGIREMNGDIFLDEQGNIRAINHILKRPNYDRQEMTLVKKNEFLNQLDAEGLEIVWFADLYRSKNALNDAIKSNDHPMKTRKYLIWFDNGEIVAEKFWDERFSNQRDKRPGEENEPTPDYEFEYEGDLPDVSAGPDDKALLPPDQPDASDDIRD